MTSIRATAAIPLLLLALALPSCAAVNAGPEPTRTSTLGPTPAPTVEPEPEASEVVVGAEGFVVLNSSGVELLSWDWEDGSPEELVAALDDHFGMPATVSEQEGDCCHAAPFDIYTWGGFTFAFADLGGDPRDTYAWPSTVTVTAAEVNSVAVTTEAGFQVGDTVVSVLANEEPLQQTEFDGVGYYWIDPSDVMTGGIRRAVQFTSDAGGTSVAGLFAPSSPDSP